MIIGDEEDSFELQKINEEEEFNFEEKKWKIIYALKLFTLE